MIYTISFHNTNKLGGEMEDNDKASNCSGVSAQERETQVCAESPVIDDAAYQDLDFCGVGFVACVDGQSRKVSGEQLLSSIAKAMTIEYGEEQSVEATDDCGIKMTLKAQEPPCISEEPSNILGFDEDGCLIVEATEICISDDDRNLIGLDEEGCLIAIQNPPCVSDDVGNIISLDEDGCLYASVCVKDADGVAYTMDADGCLIPPPETECSVSFSGREIVIDHGVTVNIDYSDYVTNEGTGELTFEPDMTTMAGIRVVGQTATGMSIRSTATSCEFGIDVEAFCNGASAGLFTVGGTHSTGTKIYGASLMPADDFENCVKGPVSPGNEFADGWTNPELDYQFNVYPPDTSIAIMEGRYIGNDDGVSDGRVFVDQKPFPGDPDHAVEGSEFWFYANGNDTGDADGDGDQDPYVIAEKTVAVTPGQKYSLITYTSNAISPDSDFGDEPRVQYLMNDVVVAASIPVPYEKTLGIPDTYFRTEVEWTCPAGVTSAKFTVKDSATGSQGDDMAMYIDGMRPVTECE